MASALEQFVNNVRTYSSQGIIVNNDFFNKLHFVWLCVNSFRQFP